MCNGDYTDNFTTNEIFLKGIPIIQWVWGISFHLGFVVVVIISDKANGQLGEKHTIHSSISEPNRSSNIK